MYSNTRVGDEAQLTPSKQANQPVGALESPPYGSGALRASVDTLVTGGDEVDSVNMAGGLGELHPFVLPTEGRW